MKRYGLYIAIGLILATNMVVLAGVAYNRSGEPDAVAELTERELIWESRWNPSKDENTGLYLSLSWDMPGYKGRYTSTEDRNWLKREKLEELDFETDYPLHQKDAWAYYRHQLPVQAYVVLELNGPAYQKWLAEAQKDLEIARNKVEREKNDKKKKSRKRDLKEIEIKIAMQSKLFAVDAGQEPGVLRNKYPDRSKYIIAPAAFKIHREKIYSKPLPASKRYFLSGRVDEILVEDIHVPNEFREFFIAEIKSPTIQYLPHDKPTSDLKPRYSVTVNYGKRYEPWIAAVNKLE